MLTYKFRIIIRIFIILFLFLFQLKTALHADPANSNIVIVAGETWSSYVPANFDYDWPSRTVYTDVVSVSGSDPQGCVLFTGRMIDKYYYGTPPWSWMSGKLAIDFDNGINAIEHNPSAEFAEINKDLVTEGNENYTFLKYVPGVVGADDPERNFHDPEGGTYLSEDRTYAWASAGWPTTLGVDVKLTVHSWTMPWGHLDDFHLIEMEFYNTGQTDLNGDGEVELTNNKINALTFLYWPGCFHFKMTASGYRTYYVDNNRYRGSIIDLTPDETGAPWDIYCQAIGSTITDAEDHPAISREGEYYDAYNGYNWLGAKKWNPETGAWEEKFLAFKDTEGNEVVPAIGEGAQRGWFHTTQPGWGDVFDGSEKKAHIAGMGCFFVDGGKSNDGAKFNLKPNPALFESGTEGQPATFVVKNPAEWQYPDGAWEMAEPVMVHDPVTGEALGINPIDPSPDRGHAMEPDIITQGLISQYQFDGDPVCGFGPLTLEVGERVRVYFYRGSGFRMNGLRKTVKMVRAVFNSIKPDGSIEAPTSPPVPEIKVSGSANVRPLIKWQDPAILGAADGIKIYKSVAWPRYKSTKKLFPTHETWWKTNDPNSDPGSSEVNPLLDLNHEYLRDQQGDFWGPYTLVKIIPAEEYDAYPNPDDDQAEFPFAWEDSTYTAPGQSYWYYVSSYRIGAAAGVPMAYQGLDDVDWLESGKVNTNGRSAQWEATWPWSWNHAWYPADTDVIGQRNLGAAFVLVSPPATIPDIEFNRAKIGVRPNPYKRVAFHDASDKHQLMFYNLPSQCTIQVYDLAGMLIDEIDFLAPTEENGTYFWDMFSKNGNEVASGLYIWVVKYEGGLQKGTLAILR